MEINTRFQEFLDLHKYLSEIDNLSINFGPVQNVEDHPLEQVFYSNLFKALSQWQDFKQFDFFIIGVNKPYDFKFDKNSIVFCLSNETHTIPKDLLEAGVIFSPYCPLIDQIPNCYPIPLGYNGSLLDLPMKNITTRKYDVFFSGNVYRKRIPFYLNIKIHQLINAFNKLLSQSTGKEYLQFNRKFTGGMTPKEYSEILMDTKVALVPEGYLSDISFRFFEAAKMGCVILTRELYDYWFFDKFPGCQLKSWRKLHKHLKLILSDSNQLEEMQKEMLAYYANFCSEKATSQFVIEKITSSLKDTFDTNEKE